MDDNPSLFGAPNALGPRPEQLPPDAPLAARMRPRTLAEFLGQRHIVGEGAGLRTAIESGRPPSMILWGPPGSGKTTLARLIAATAKARFVGLSAVTAGVADLRRVLAEASVARRAGGADTVLSVGEMSRCSKAP